MRVFWQRGYAYTTLDDIGQATGLGRGSLYSTFGSKNDLFLRALDRYAQLYGGLYTDALATSASPTSSTKAEAAVRAFFDVALKRFADASVPDGCLLVQSVAEGPALEPATREHVTALTRNQYSRLRSAMDNSELPQPERDELARLFVTVNQGLAVMHRAGATPEQLSGVVERAISALKVGQLRCGSGPVS